jgi:hypothetical protein
MKGLAELPPLFSADPNFEGGVIEVNDNDYYIEPLSIQLPISKSVEVRAADEKRRPTLIIDGDALLSGGRDSELTLNGLLVASGSLGIPQTINNRLGKLVLRHCTLVPGATPIFAELGIPGRPAAPKLVIEIPGVEVVIDSCIIGPLRVHEDSRVTITNTIVDAGAATEVAYAGVDPSGGGAPVVGGALDLTNSTVIGRVHTKRIDASNTILFASFANGDRWPAPFTLPRAPVLAERVQEGCVRFSYVPPGSHIPRPFRCQPETAEDDPRVRPAFTSLRYGDAAYGQLSRYSAVEILEGADDGAEMGAFHDLFQPQRVANLRARLDEYLRFGLEAGIFFAT